MRRRRLLRNIGNFLLISSLSIGAAYVITRPSGGRGFTPGAGARTALSNPPAKADSSVANPTAPMFTSSSREPAAAATGYNLAPGPLTVSEVADVVLHDAKRNKDVHVRVFYPAEAGKYPVIVFSHGAGGSQTCCESLTQHWASYGYVTIQPTHDDSALLRRNGGEEDIRFTQAVRDALKKPELWESRPRTFPS